MQSEYPMLSEDPFLDAAKKISEHPFLQASKEGNLPHSVWATYVANRLGAGTDFVEYLKSLSEKAKSEGYEGIYSAAQSNLDEELGFKDDMIELERTHAQWRQWFRDDMKKILTEESEIVIPEASFYPQTLQSLKDDGDVLEMTGALAGIEKLIAYEYELILEGLTSQFGEAISAEGYTYIRSHAIHDHRHFDEIFIPLGEVCKTRDDVSRVLRGLSKAQIAKTSFLDGMETFRIQSN